ncbi:MAG TPA: ATP-binding protein [Longimicrobiales bacterium]
MVDRPRSRFREGPLRDRPPRPPGLSPEERYRFLSAAGSQLASSLSYEETMVGIAARPLPYLGDWCIVDVIEPDDRLRRVAIVHPDPQKQGLVDRLRSGWPPSRDDPFGVPTVARTGELELIAHITDELLVQVAQDEDNLRILRQLGVGSLVTVPMTVRGRLIGAITYVASTGRTFTAEDVSLASDLAALSALAILNARLHEGAEAASREADARRAEAERLATLAGRLNERLLLSALEEMETAEKAESKEEAKAEFITSLTHELRTPLTAISGYAELLLSGRLGALSEKQLSSLERLGMAVRQILRLVEQILTEARIEAGKESVSASSVDVAAVARESVELLQPLAARKNLGFHCVLPDSPLMLHTDGEKVRQILLNLLSNAINFTDEGEVRLDVRPEPGGARFIVSDTGCGIPTEEQERIFERFHQLEGTVRTRRGGSGLGLPITRALVTLLAGDITLESEPARGTAFSVFVPSLEPDADGGPAVLERKQ